MRCSAASRWTWPRSCSTSRASATSTAASTRSRAASCRAQTRSYGDIAVELGDKGLARAVGQALGHNPFAPVVPCHRVLAAGGKPGGFSAHGGATAKLKMLAIEGARPPSDTEPLF